jgi:hypothetical protein
MEFIVEQKYVGLLLPEMEQQWTRQCEKQGGYADRPQFRPETQQAITFEDPRNAEHLARVCALVPSRRINQRRQS